MLSAFFVLADDAGDGPHVVLEDALNLVLRVAERTFDRHLGNRTISQAFLRLRLEHGLRDGGALTLFGVPRDRRGVILVLFGVNTEALGHEVNLDAIDVLNQTRDRWHELLHDVPVNVRLQAILTSHDFIEAKCGLIEGELRRSLRHDSILLLLLALVLLLADNVTNEIADQIGRRLSALLDESVRHYDMGQALEV